MARISTFVALIALALCTPAATWAQEGEPPLDSIRRVTPSGQYIDPASFFRFHGYATVAYTENGPDVGLEVEATPQILLNGLSPRTGKNESGFRSDAALFVGGEPFERVGTIIEIHFVGNAIDPVLTEARFTYDLVTSDSQELVLSGGRFWWPFGIHNGEWFSAVNAFPVLSPAGAEVVPAHYNEVGLMAEGVARLAGNWGVNYVAAVGNGVPGFDLTPNLTGTASDADSDRTVTGRVALARVSALRLEIGFSGAAGGLRDGMDTSLPVDDAMRYDASFSAFGTDLTLRWDKLVLSAYYYRSSEQLTGAPVSELSRDGFTVESSLRLPIPENDRLQAVSLQVRASRADEDNLTGGVYRRLQFAGGTMLHLTRRFDAQFSYVVHQEGRNTPTYSNNVFSLSFTVEF